MMENTCKKAKTRESGEYFGRSLIKLFHFNSLSVSVFRGFGFRRAGRLYNMKRIRRMPYDKAEPRRRPSGTTWLVSTRCDTLSGSLGLNRIEWWLWWAHSSTSDHSFIFDDFAGLVAVLEALPRPNSSTTPRLDRRHVVGRGRPTFQEGEV